MNTTQIPMCALAVRISLVLALCGPGCGPSRSSLEQKIRGLEKEIAALKADKVNLTASKAALDDKVVILERKVETCQKDKDRPRLQVVRLNPDDPPTEAPEPPTVIREQPAQASKRGTSGGQSRPLLVLRGNGDWRTPGDGAAPPAGGDNLGVVTTGPSGESPGDAALGAFQSAYLDYSNKRYDAALEGFAAFVAERPTHPYADNAIYWRGECYLALGKNLKAIGEYERLLARYPESDAAPSAIYRIGFVYDRLGDRLQALDHYYRVVERYPGSEAARKASLRVSAIQQEEARAGVVPTALAR